MKKLLLLFTVLTFSVFTFAQQVGDYQSGLTGNWSDISTWQVWNGFLWGPASSAPTGGDNVTIRTGHLVTVTGSTGDLDFTGNLVLNPLGQLDMTGYALSKSGSGTILIQSDANGTGEVIFDNATNATVSATVERYIDDSGWHQIAFGGDPSPANTISASVVDQNNNPNVWLMRFDNANSNWVFIEDPSTNLYLWYGYAVLGATSFTFSYTEAMTSDDQTLTDNGAQLDHWAPITNPYSASYEPFKGGTTLGTGLYDRIWVWDPNYGTGDYRVFNGTSGDFTGIVARGQSFFVQADVTGQASYLYDASYRQFASDNNFFKKGSSDGWDDNFGQGFYAMFKVTDEGIGENNAFVIFGDNGTPSDDDGYDVPKFFGSETNPRLYLVEDNLKLTIDYLSNLEESEERIVKMNLEPGMTGKHILAANLDSLENVKVTLEDIKTGSFHVFNDESTYEFNALENDDPGRFLIHFNYDPTGINEEIGANTNKISIYTYNKNVYIEYSNKANIQSEIRIYDLMGREIYVNDVFVSGTVKIPVNIDNSYLIVQVISNDNVTTQKIFVK